MKLDTQERIAANLKQLRRSHNLSQAQLSSTIQLDRSLYALYESGKRTPDLDVLDRICLFYGIRIEVLMKTDPENVVSEAAFCQLCDDGDLKILDLFRALTPFSKGKLMEKAESLAEWDAFRANQRQKLQSHLVP